MATLHVVPHTHWDREWYLPFQTMRIKLVHLVDSLLELLAARPDYRHFTLDGQTIVVDDYLRIRPERRGEIVGHVATGRLLVGPWTVLPDEFLVSPESIVRNLQLGSRAALEWGGRMDVGYVPDPFGHIGQLPQILRGFGIETAAFRRGLAEEPCELWWASPDGGRVLVSYLRDGYDNAARLPDDREGFRAVVERRSARLAPHSAVSHRLLLNGTDHHEAQPELPSMLEGPPPEGDRWILSTLPAYLAAVRDEVEARAIDLPVVRGELRNPRRHHLLPGVLSSRSWIKERNDHCEQRLETWAEPFVSWAELLCADQPDRNVWTGHVETPRVRGASAFVEEAWRILLTCHPHDSICGCSVDQVHDEMRPRFDQVEQIAEEITRQSLAALANAVDTRKAGAAGATRALVVFNPANLAGAGRARAEVELGAGMESFEVVDPGGAVLPHRVLGRQTEELANLDFAPGELRALMRGVEDGWVAGLAVEEVDVARDGSRLRVELLVSETGEPNRAAVAAGLDALRSALDEPDVEGVRLVARFATRAVFEVAVPDLPPHGYRTVGLRPAAVDPELRIEEGVRIGNESLEVEAAPDGTVTLVGRESGRRISGLLRLRDEADRGDSYTFCPVSGDEPIEKPSQVSVTRRTGTWGEELEIEQTLRVPARLAPDRVRRSDEIVDLAVRVRISLVPGVARADVEISVDNRAEDHRLQVLFPLGARVEEGIYDGHYEVVRRPAGAPEGGADWQEQPTAEQPMRAFVAARAAGRAQEGLLVAAHGLREASVSAEGVIAVTLLRCFGWLSRDDLSTRAGGAGPALPTPGGQCAGMHTFRLALIPFEGDVGGALARADAYRAQPRGVATGMHAGRLPLAASFARIEPSHFRLTAVQPESGGGSTVVRGVYLGETSGEVRLTPLERPVLAERVRLDGMAIERVAIDDGGTLRIRARPHEIVSVRLRYRD